MASKKTTPPADLADRGLKFWKHTVRKYNLTESELSILVEACRTMDNLDSLTKSIEDVGTMTSGSAGQPVVNPAVTEIRGQRIVLHRLVNALNLPADDGAVVKSARTTRAQTAANKRWFGNKAGA